MAKKVAVLAVNPVNGCGLFQYLEAFFENGISYNIDLMEVIKTFGDKGKIMIGHCAGAMMFDFTGITKGKKVAVHPLAKPAIQNGIATDEKSEIDGNFFTAQDENTIWTMLPQVIEALK